MPTSRVALYALSLVSVIFAVRSVLGKPLSLLSALALVGAYGTLLALGAVAPRLGLFADVLTEVAPNEFAIVVRCSESDVAMWLPLLERHQLVVTFSLPSVNDDTKAAIRAASHAVVKRHDPLSVRRFLKSAQIDRDESREVKLIDIERRWLTPWFGRALRMRKVLWLAPHEEVPSSSPRIGAVSGRVVSVSGSPKDEAIARWKAEIVEARVIAVGLVAISVGPEA